MMDKSKSAWFFGWFVTRKGGPTSGNYGHKGRRGKRGGSMPGGGHTAIGIHPLARKEERAYRIQQYRKKMGTEKPKEKGIGQPADFERGLDHKALYGAFSGIDVNTPVEEWPVKIGNAGLIGAQTREEWRYNKTKVLSEATGAEWDAVEGALNTWEETSNDNNLKALSMQEACSEEFGVPLSAWQKTKLQEQSDLRERYLEQYEEDAAKHGEDPVSYLPSNMQFGLTRGQERSMLREMYDQTQQAFKDAGYKPGDTVRLFRGVGTTEDIKAGDVVDLTQNAMSSWTALNDPTAASFARGATYQKLNGAILAMDVPIESVLSTARTGFGMFSEAEFVVLGTPGNQASVGLVYYR